MIMAKFEIKFLDAYNDDYIKVNKAIHHFKESVRIKIFDNEYQKEFLIDLDKSTAIKFAKTLRTEINKIKED